MAKRARGGEKGFAKTALSEDLFHCAVSLLHREVTASLAEAQGDLSQGARILVGRAREDGKAANAILRMLCRSLVSQASRGALDAVGRRVEEEGLATDVSAAAEIWQARWGQVLATSRGAHVAAVRLWEHCHTDPELRGAALTVGGWGAVLAHEGISRAARAFSTST